MALPKREYGTSHAAVTRFAQSARCPPPGFLEMRRSFAFPIHLTLATCLGTVFLCVLLLNGSCQQPGTEAAGHVLQVKQGTTAPARQGALGGYSKIVETVRPCIVSILSWNSLSGAAMPDANNPPGNSPETSDAKPALMGVGSGIILTEIGHILTNNHVVASAQWVWVVLPDSTDRLNAQVVGRDAETDLAVLKIERPGLTAATFGDSDLMKAGDVVLAIGNPFGLSQTVTSGIVSATSRNDLDIAGFENFIQTDASINPGNSGGALINTNCEVIGINTAIFSRNGGSVGVGFAISGNLALKIARKLAEKGEIARGYLGVTVSTLTQELAKVFGVDCRGTLVSDVSRNSPADRAGCKPGDIILAINSEPVTSPSQFRMAVADLEPESRVAMRIVRKGENQLLEATVSRTPDGIDAALQELEKQPPPAHPEPFLNGVYIQELTPALRLEHGIPSKINGVIITHARPSTVLESGLRPGIVICEVAGKPVDSVPKALQERTADKTRGALLLRVWVPGKGFQFAAVKTTRK